MYELTYDIDALENPDEAEYKIQFDLNDVVNKIDPSLLKVEIAVFTCWCCDKDCEMHPEYVGFNVEKVITLDPSNEEKVYLSEPSQSDFQTLSFYNGSLEKIYKFFQKM